MIYTDEKIFKFISEYYLNTNGVHIEPTSDNYFIDSVFDDGTEKHFSGGVLYKFIGVTIMTNNTAFLSENSYYTVPISKDQVRELKLDELLSEH